MIVNAVSAAIPAGTAGRNRRLSAAMVQTSLTVFAPAEPRDRAAPRHKVFQPAALRFDGAVHRIHLLNVSRSGALCHAAASPAVGATARVAALGVELEATVTWVKGNRFGVAFAVPLDTAGLAALVGGPA